MCCQQHGPLTESIFKRLLREGSGSERAGAVFLERSSWSGPPGEVLPEWSSSWSGPSLGVVFLLDEWKGRRWKGRRGAINRFPKTATAERLWEPECNISYSMNERGRRLNGNDRRALEVRLCCKFQGQLREVGCPTATGGG